MIVNKGRINHFKGEQICQVPPLCFFFSLFSVLSPINQRCESLTSLNTPFKKIIFLSFLLFTKNENER